jgi:hypothetical protein
MTTPNKIISIVAAAGYILTYLEKIAKMHFTDAKVIAANE